jgi:hypothetical protein
MPIPSARAPFRSDRGQRIGNLLLVILVGVILLQGALAVTTHRSTAEWLSVWEQGTVEERLMALQVLTNRTPDLRIFKDLIQQLLSSPDPRLREFAYLPTITRFQVRLQRQHLEAARESPVRIRQNFFLHYRPGPSRTMKLKDLRRYLNSLEQTPSDPVQDHDQ